MMNKQTAAKTTETEPNKQAHAPERKHAPAGAFLNGPQRAAMALQDAAGNRAVGQLLGGRQPGRQRDATATGGLLQRKCACGKHTTAGGECAECRQKKQLGLQTKLKVNEPGDRYEQEADRVAEQVMAVPAHPAVSGAPLRIQRFSGQSNGLADAAPASVDHALASPGRPLEPALRQDMEQRFGHDFSQVRVHSGAAAEQSAHDVNAHAYTVGNNMVFGASRFAPGTYEGRRLIAHELTHLVQQRQSHDLGVQTGALRVQRQPMQTSQSGMGLPLTDKERGQLEAQARFNMTRAHTAYSRAADANQRALKSAAASTSSATFWSVLFDIAMGFLAPGLARGVAALADKIPVGVSNLSYRVGLLALNQKGVERVFAAATKVGKEVIKQKMAVLHDENATDLFIQSLVDAFDESIQKVSDDLQNKTDQEVATVAAVYHESVANRAIYSSTIGDLVYRYTTQVLVLTRQPGKSLLEIESLIWVRDPDSVEYLGRFTGSNPRIHIDGWVDSEFKDLALATKGNRVIRTVSWKELENPNRISSARAIPNKVARKELPLPNVIVSNPAGTTMILSTPTLGQPATMQVPPGTRIFTMRSMVPQKDLSNHAEGEIMGGPLTGTRGYFFVPDLTFEE